MSTFKYSTYILIRKQTSSCVTLLCPRNSVISLLHWQFIKITSFPISDENHAFFLFTLLLTNSPLRAAADIERCIFSIDSGEPQIIDGLADQVSSVSEKCLQSNNVRLVTCMLFLPMLSIYSHPCTSLKQSAKPGIHKLMPVSTRALRTVTNRRLRSQCGATRWGIEHAHLYRGGLSAINTLLRHPRLFFFLHVVYVLNLLWQSYCRYLQLARLKSIYKNDLIRVREYKYRGTWYESVQFLNTVRWCFSVLFYRIRIYRLMYLFISMQF